MNIDYFRLLLTAVFPGIALAIAVYLADRYDKEPVTLLLKVFIFGALSTVPVIFIESILSFLNDIMFTGILSIAFTSFIIAGATEEYFKRLVVLKMAYKNDAFNEKMDGIVYCVFSALGFATLENILYVFSNFSVNPYIGLYRGILSVPAHFLFAVTMGYYLSMAKYCENPSLCQSYYKKSLTVPLILHGIFDFILMSQIQLLMTLFIPFVIYLWIVNLKKLNIYYREQKPFSV